MPVAGVPVVDHGLMYWQHASTPAGTSYYRDFADDELRARAVGWLVERIEEIAAAHTTPYLILVYADLHSYDRHVSLHQEAARRLDPTRFKPARLDEALSALRRWSEDRILVDADGLNNRLVWAALEGVPTYATLDLVNPGVTTRRVEVALTDHDASRAVDIEAGGRATLLDLRLPREGGATELVVRHSGGEDWHPVTVVPVALETGAKAAHFRALWDATSLRHGGGLAVPSPEAPDRLVWSSPQAGEPSGNILHGPYAEMPPGRYLVAFRMARPPGTETGAEGRIALLDVNPGGYEGLNQSLGELPVGAEDAPADGSFRWYGLEVDWPGSPNLLEARVWWDGRAPLLLDRVAVFELQ